MKVRGNLILISADIARSLEKILPNQQQIIPVRFKRKLVYTGHYAAEYIDRVKVELYFNWFKQNNPLFSDFSLDEELVNKFERDLGIECDMIFQKSQSNPDAQPQPHEVADEVDLLSDVEEEVETLLPSGPEDYHGGIECDDDKENEQEVPVSQQHSTVMCGKYADVYEPSSEANKLASLIVYLEQEKALEGKSEVDDEVDLDHMTNEVSDFFPDDNVDVDIPDEMAPENEGRLDTESKKFNMIISKGGLDLRMITSKPARGSISS